MDVYQLLANLKLTKSDIIHHRWPVNLKIEGFYMAFFKEFFFFSNDGSWSAPKTTENSGKLPRLGYRDGADTPCQ